MSGRLARLAELARMIRDAELGRLAAAEADRRAAAAGLAGLRDERSAVRRRAAPDAARRAGAQDRWEIWAEARERTQATALAQAAAEAEACKVRARRAFGRAEVLGRLAARPQTPRRDRE